MTIQALYRYRELSADIAMLTEEIESLRTRIGSNLSETFCGSGKGCVGKPTESTAVLLAAKAEQLKELKTVAEKEREKVMDYVLSVRKTDPFCSALMYDRFICGLSWNAMGKKHGNAGDTLRKIVFRFVDRTEETPEEEQLNVKPYENYDCIIKFKKQKCSTCDFMNIKTSTCELFREKIAEKQKR